MIYLGDTILDQKLLSRIVFNDEHIAISPNVLQRLKSMYQIVKQTAQSPKAFYGINTGFGALAEMRISADDQSTLQRNIILSHAVGVGQPLDFTIAKTMTVLRLNTLVQGFSGPSPELLNHLVLLINNNIAPLVPHKGSVGASGDLAPLAHLGLLLLGIGDCLEKNQVISSQQALEKTGLKPLELGTRDGLALINGTQAMAASGLISLIDADFLVLLADLAGASSLDALAGHLTPFNAQIHALKPHPGQQKTAENILHAIAERRIHEHVKNPLTQDPYSLRCIPQVHGATKDVVTHVRQVIERELNSVTDNPLLFLNSDQELTIMSGGNFHGQSLALALDYLGMAIAELANISERRIELLLNPKHSNGLPAFLAKNSGLNSGYMMLHVTASALINENKVLCHPASTDSIPTSANREDHVSMGMTSANKLRQIIDNTKTVLAIELLAAHQALDFRPPQSAGRGVRAFHETVRAAVPFRESDAIFIQDLNSLLHLLKTLKTTKEVEDIFTY